MAPRFAKHGMRIYQDETLFARVDALDLLVGVGAGQVEEHGRGAIKDIARVLHCLYGIGERRRCGIVGDSRNRLALGGEPLVEHRTKCSSSMRSNSGILKGVARVFRQAGAACVLVPAWA